MRPALQEARSRPPQGPSRYATGTWPRPRARGATCGPCCTGGTALRAWAGAQRQRRRTKRRQARTREASCRLSAWATSWCRQGGPRRRSRGTKRRTPSIQATRRFAPGRGARWPWRTAATGSRPCSTTKQRRAGAPAMRSFARGTARRWRWRAGMQRRPSSIAGRSRRIPTTRPRAWASETRCRRWAGTKRPSDRTGPESGGATSSRSHRAVAAERGGMRAASLCTSSEGPRRTAASAGRC